MINSRRVLKNNISWMKNKKIFFIIGFFFLSFIFLIFSAAPQNIFGSKKLSIKAPDSIGNFEDENKTEIQFNEKEYFSENKTSPAPSEKSQLTAKKETSFDNSSESIKSKEKLKENNLVIKNKLVSWGFAPASSRFIDTIIIHSSYDALGDDPFSVEGLLAEYKQYGVAPHYLIDRQGNIFRLVAEKNVAYHAGQSRTSDGRENVNNFSIGIELMNTKNEKFTDKQYDSLSNLLADIKSRLAIKYILGHNQIAPNRKTDPWNFEWKRINAD